MSSDQKRHRKSLDNPPYKEISERLKVSDFNFDKLECSVLQMMRFHCISVAEKRPEDANHLEIIAISRFGESSGKSISNALLAILQKLFEARQSHFNFTSPTCQCCRITITDCEARVMRSLHDLRRQQTPNINLDLLVLCEGANSDHVKAKIEDLAEILGSDTARK